MREKRKERTFSHGMISFIFFKLSIFKLILFLIDLFNFNFTIYGTAFLSGFCAVVLLSGRGISVPLNDRRF